MAKSVKLIRSRYLCHVSVPAPSGAAEIMLGAMVRRFDRLSLAQEPELSSGFE